MTQQNGLNHSDTLFAGLISKRTQVTRVAFVCAIFSHKNRNNLC